MQYFSFSVWLTSLNMTLTKQKETHRLREWTYGCWGKEWREGVVREFGIDRYTLLYLKWITNKDLLYSKENSAWCHVTAWMGGKFGGERIQVYVWLSPFAIHLKLSQHYLLISYTPTQNKNFFKKEEEKKENSEFTKLTGCGAVAINYFL